MTAAYLLGKTGLTPSGSPYLCIPREQHLMPPQLPDVSGNKYAWRYSKCVAVSFQQSLQYSAIVGGRGKCNTKSSSTVRRVYACFSEYLRHCLADPTSSCCVLCFWHNFRYRFHPNWHLRHTQIPRTLLWWCHIPAQRCCEPAVLQAPGSRPHRGSFLITLRYRGITDYLPRLHISFWCSSGKPPFRSGSTRFCSGYIQRVECYFKTIMCLAIGTTDG